MLDNELTIRLRKRYESSKPSAERLAIEVLTEYFKEKTPEFPIDIFKMIRDFGVFYKFSDLKKLEGAYLPGTDNAPPVVAVNINRGFQRQRFTCAHELAHHLKDYASQVICPFNSGNPIERYADKFASELLMPTKFFLEEAGKLKGSDGFVSDEDAFKLCNIFGTSYRAVIWKLYFNSLLSFKPSDNFFRKAKPAQKLSEDYYDMKMLRQIINSYTYFPPDNTSYLWNSFKNELVFQDSRLEGVEIDLNSTAEMITDIRLFGKKSEYFEKLNKGRAYEVIGHSFMYQYITETDLTPDRAEILNLHKILFEYAPIDISLGEFRKIDNRISGANIQTVPHQQIEQEIYLLVKDIDGLIQNITKFDIVNYLRDCVFIHHQLTKIHPFEDGNGRISRTVMNWLLRLKGLPPLYVSYDDKEPYFKALMEADQFNFNELELYFMRQLLSSFVELNDRLSTRYHYEGIH